jgi:glycerate kinase
MKILVALDSFKGSLDSISACRAVQDGFLEADSDLEVFMRPLADGGEGTAAAFLTALGGEWVVRRVRGPLKGQEVEAGFALFPDKQAACVEMAQASGLTLVEPESRDPLVTTTFGTGELILTARELGAETVWLGVGGSATVDGGLGAAAAFGWKFLDASGAELLPQGESLPSIVEVIKPPKLDPPVIKVLCDVQNPLLGKLGAARVFGPQKGADAGTVEFLERGLGNLAARVSASLRLEIGEMTCGGAAGGLAAGAVAFLAATLESGIERVMTETGFEALLADMDWVISGEGSFDSQSLNGKVVDGVARAARNAGVPMGVLAGRVALEESDWKQAGIQWAIPSAPPDMPQAEAMNRAESLLKSAAGKASVLIKG